jgi:hypothetical protein
MIFMRRLSALLCGSLAILAVISGCDEPKPSPKAIKPRETIGKTTQNVLRLDEALKSGGVLAGTTIEATNPLDQNAQAYRVEVAKIAQMKVDMDMRMYEAEHGKYPENYDEFMEFIIKKGKPDGIQLPMLPYYQEYAYDEANKKLVAVEFPEKKKQFQEEQDKRFGRK